MNLRDGHQPGGLALAVRRPNLTRPVAGLETTPSEAVSGPMLSGGGSRPVQPITTGLVEPGSGGRRFGACRDAIGLGSAAGLPVAGLAAGLILRADATAHRPPFTGVKANGSPLRMAVVVSGRAAFGRLVDADADGVATGPARAGGAAASGRDGLHPAAAHDAGSAAQIL